MRIGLLGDTHANYGWLMYALNKFNREGIEIIIQVGDFGIWPGENNAAMMDRVNLLLKNYRQTLYVVPGNHEDYDQINAVPVSEYGWQYFRDRILLAPRGHRWTWDGVSFVALGGAPSVDRAWRKQQMNASVDAFPPGQVPEIRKVWWDEEFITPEDVAKVVAGGYADVMITHDAPKGINEIDRRISGNPGGYAAADLIYAADGRETLTQAYRAVAPKFLFHGHYHFLIDERINALRGDDWHRCHVLGLSKDLTNFSMGEFDTERQVAKPWDILIDYNLNKYL